MTPPPSFSFEQALALLQSGQYRHIPDSTTATHHSLRHISPSRQHGSSPQTTSRTRSSGNVESSQSSVFTFQDALAILQSAEHRNDSYVGATQAMSHRTSPSTYRQNTAYSATATQQASPHWLSPSHTPSRERSRPMPASTSTPTPRSSYVENSEPIVPISYRQALAMLQRGEHRTSSVAILYGTSHHQARSSSMHHQNTPRTNRHATMSRDRRQPMTSATRINQPGSSSTSGPTFTPTFQEALARLHSITVRPQHQTALSRSHQHDTHTAASQVRSPREGSRPVSTTSLSDDIQRHRRPLHQEATASAAFEGANRNYTNVLDRRLHHREVLHNCEAHRQQSNESDPSMKLANLPSLSFEEACKIINWRSATKMEGVNCGICLDDFESKDKVHLFPNCNHLFHVECVKDWLLKVGSCPCCRDTIINIKNSDPE